MWSISLCGRADSVILILLIERKTEGKAMQKLLTTAANHIQASGNVPDSLVAKIKQYDRAHGMWACMATDEMLETWQNLQFMGKV